jgi:hypothetical protein
VQSGYTPRSPAGRFAMCEAANSKRRRRSGNRCGRSLTMTIPREAGPNASSSTLKATVPKMSPVLGYLVCSFRFSGPQRSLPALRSSRLTVTASCDLSIPPAAAMARALLIYPPVSRLVLVGYGSHLVSVSLPTRYDKNCSELSLVPVPSAR